MRKSHEDVITLVGGCGIKGETRLEVSGVKEFEPGIEKLNRR